MTWIKCSDRLPQNLERVLIEKPLFQNIVIIAMFVESHDGAPCFINDYRDIRNNLIIYKLDDVAIWQPLPKLPKD